MSTTSWLIVGIAGQKAACLFRSAMLSYLVRFSSLVKMPAVSALSHRASRRIPIPRTKLFRRICYERGMYQTISARSVPRTWKSSMHTWIPP